MDIWIDVYLGNESCQGLNAAVEIRGPRGQSFQVRRVQQQTQPSNQVASHQVRYSTGITFAKYFCIFYQPEYLQ